MQVTTEQIDPCKIALTITVEPEKVTVAQEKAYQQAARSITLPGFRKGKVPLHIARGYVDPSRVKQRAAELLVPEAFQSAVGESQVEPWGQADFEVVEMNDDGPLVFKALVPLRPQVTLGPYKGLSLTKRVLVVTDKDVERQIEQIRERYAEYPEVEDRTAQPGDLLLVDLQAEIEGKELPELAEARSTAIEVGKNIPDFDNGLTGMAKGETKTIEAIYPETFPDDTLRGKRATFTVTLNEIRSRNLPELNDELVQKAHPTAKTPDELLVAVRDSLEKTAAEMSENELEFNLVNAIVQSSQIHFPDVLLRAEMQADAQQLQERLERDQITLDDFLVGEGKTREELQLEMSTAAAQRIRNSLVLSEVARTESIAVDDTEVDAKIAERAEQAKVSPAAVRAFAEKNNQLERFRDQALTEKILTFLKGAATIAETTFTSDDEQEETAEPSAAPAGPATPEVKKRRTTKKKTAEEATEEA
jgi:trigger factor